MTLLQAPVQAVQVMPRDYHLSRTWVEVFLWLSLALAFAGWGIETGGLAALQEVGCTACSTKAVTLFASLSQHRVCQRRVACKLRAVHPAFGQA